MSELILGLFSERPESQHHMDTVARLYLTFPHHLTMKIRYKYIASQYTIRGYLYLDAVTLLVR